MKLQGRSRPGVLPRLGRPPNEPLHPARLEERNANGELTRVTDTGGDEQLVLRHAHGRLQGRQRPLKVVRALACLLGLALVASHAPAMADSTSDCGSVFFVQPRHFIGAPNASVAEIFVKESGQEEYSLRGLLLWGDWGALRMCAPSFSVQVRWIRMPHQSLRVLDPRQISVNRAGRRDVFLNFDTFQEMSEEQGVKEVAGVERHWDSAAWIGRWDFDKDRYDQICASPTCGNAFRPPEAASSPR